MKRKQGFFYALKDKGVRGRNTSRSASTMSGLLRHRTNRHVSLPEPFIARSGSLRPVEALSPLKEGLDPDGLDGGDSKIEGRWGHWMKGWLSRASSFVFKRSNLRLLLGVLGAPLAPVHVSTTDP